MKKLFALLLAFLLFFSLSACGASYSEADQKIAEEVALQKAETYCKQNLEGRTYGGYPITSYHTHIKDTAFKNGKYVVTVKISFNVPYDSGTKYGTLSLSQYWEMDCVVAVQDGKGIIKSTDVRTD